MASDSNPRAAIHDLWESFVPSFTFAVLFAALLLFFLGSGSFETFIANLIATLSQLENSPLKDKLEQLELLKLLPVAVFFSLAVALYLFDRIVLGLGSTLPPHPFWVGNAYLYLPEDRLLRLWGMSPKIQDFNELAGEVERLTERAQEENQTRLLDELEWPNKRFSKAANWLAYSKLLILWCIICALVAQANFVPGLTIALRLVVSLASCAAFFVIALACETHCLLEQHEVRLRIAERMRNLDGAEFFLDGDRNQQFSVSRANAWKYSSRPFVRLGWGSGEPFRRVLRTFWWRGSQGQTASKETIDDAPNTVGRADG